MQQALWIVTFLLGVVATILPAYFAAYFWHIANKSLLPGARFLNLPRVLSFMLAGEAVSMFAATYFSFSSVMNVYNTMNVYETMALRWLIFLTGVLSTGMLIRYLVEKYEYLFGHRRS